ncbi:MAG: hypothetical protein KDA44_18530 [Planctomycetales bacterium]|nr:hypothetical protein [Planctomycetales bacterium]
MTEQLLAYLLDDLSAAERLEVEARLADDPTWQAEFARLRDCLAGCDGDCDDVPATPAAEDAPPADLVARTCTLVESGVYESLASLEGGSETRNAACAYAGHCGSWRFIDLAVAAGVLVALGGLLLPALVESREASRRTVCQNKLRALGAEFVAYAERNNHQLPPLRPGQNAGMYAVYIADQCGLPREDVAELLICPATQLAEDVARGRARLWVPTRKELSEACGPALIALRQQMGGTFAYRFGFFDPDGQLHQVRFVGSDQLPVLADAPDSSPMGFVSQRHGSSGENVLYQSMSVRFVSGHVIPNGDDLFCNRAGQHAAGLDRDDMVLGRSEFEPLGTIFPMGE